jgi:molecular chaperone Hsp33
MMTSDFLRKFIFEEFAVKGSLVRLDESWREVCARARPAELARNMLGEVIAASVLLTSNLKFKGTVSLQIQSNGPVRLLLGQCSNDHQVRGVLKMAEGDEDPREPVLSINLEPEDGGAPYQGIVSLGQDGVAAALQEYFTMSEQLGTRFFLVAGDHACAGLMLQRMPGQMPDHENWNRVVHLASTITDEELTGLEPEVLIHRLFHEDDVRLFKPSAVRFGCKCSVERVSGMLRGLGEKEAEDIIAEQGLVEVHCQYCGTAYRFDPVDVARLFAGGFETQEKPGLQ